MIQDRWAVKAKMHNQAAILKLEQQRLNIRNEQRALHNANEKKRIDTLLKAMDDKLNTENEVATLTLQLEKDLRTSSNFKMHIGNLQATGLVSTAAARELIISIDGLRVTSMGWEALYKEEVKKGNKFLAIEVINKGT